MKQIKPLTTLLLILLLALPACAGNRQDNSADMQTPTLMSQETDFSEEPMEATPRRKGSRVQTYGVAFYNLENLFDTKDDPKINDEDFLPNGKYEWTEEKYQNKLDHMSHVLADLCPDASDKGASLIGVAEVENRQVVNDLLRQKWLKDRGYRILHVDSPDKRGIDCALLYRPSDFVLQDSDYVQYKSQPGDKMYTRGFLVAIGKLADQPLAVIVCHWPSRGSESYTREAAGSQVKEIGKQLQQKYPGISLIVMGDLNDDPDNKSLSKSLHTLYTPAEAAGKNGEFYNPWKYTLRNEDRGTLRYKGAWNLFDQIIVSGDLVSADLEQGKGKKDTKVKYGKQLTLTEHDIFCPEYIQETEEKYRGNPLRTHVGTRWMKGYSDHFPTYIYLKKK